MPRPRPRTAVLATLALLVGGLSALATVPAAQADGTANIQITEIAYGGKAVYSGDAGDGEYSEVTNTGSAAQDLTGWSYARSTTAAAPTAGVIDLSGLGTLAAGESMIITDLTAADFRTEWGLKSTVKVINDGAQTINSGPITVGIFNGSTLVDSLGYAKSYFSGKGVAAWVNPGHLADTSTATAGAWTNPATVGDAEGSWTSAGGSVGSPAASTQGTSTPSSVRVPAAPTTDVTCTTEAPDRSLPATAGTTTWPGSASPAVSDDYCAWDGGGTQQDLSGLVFDPTDPSILWAVKNKSTVYKLVKQAGVWTRATDHNWANGKAIRFPTGSSSQLPDSEGMTVGPDGALYITTERDNGNKNTALDSILRFDPNSDTTTVVDGSVNRPVLVATDQWDLTSDLVDNFGFNPTADANLGFEGVTYVPDSYLTAYGFKTDAGAVYDPANYPTKVTNGLFFAAVEKTGHLLAYALNSDHSYTRVADVNAGQVGVMDTSYDAGLHRIWTQCDNTCGTTAALLGIDSDGHFAVQHLYARPANLPDNNLEGFAVAPISTAADGKREVVWSDDGNFGVGSNGTPTGDPGVSKVANQGGHSLWSGTIDVALGLTQDHQPSVSVGGTGVYGTTLTANVGTWDPGSTQHYAWSTDDGATSLGTPDNPLSLDDPSLVGRTVTLTVTSTETGFATVTKTATKAVTAASWPTTKPGFTGDAKVGGTVTATPPADYPSGTTFSYTWYADGSSIGAGSSFVVPEGAYAKTLTVTATPSTKAGYEDPVESPASDGQTVAAGDFAKAPKPRISGWAKVGRTLTAITGTWSPEPDFTYAWYVGSTKMGSKATFKVPKSAAGKRIHLEVTGTRTGYDTTTTTSDKTNPVKR